MAAIELFHHDGRTAGIWYCGTCRVVHASQQSAEECHGDGKCACGNPLESPYRNTCQDCDNKAWQERMTREEFARYEKAAKVSESDWKGDQVFFGDKYYEDVDEAVESAESDGGSTPKYVWATKNVGVNKADISDLLERIIEEMWEDADYSDLNGVEELEASIDAFNKANESVVVWMVEYSTAILVAPRIQEAPHAD